MLAGNDNGGKTDLHNTACRICAPPNFVYRIDDIRSIGSFIESRLLTTVDLHSRCGGANLGYVSAPIVGLDLPRKGLCRPSETCVAVSFRSHEVCGLGGVIQQQESLDRNTYDCITGSREQWCMIR